ncbi:hypothetical protein [Candidatus Absconditicoccus praedator]|uniref:hypothetical protein n=1 Tax=Candidatus Absconditicoccus praedator TaxID=2735562 RepID=UPI001E63F654|nr:hypothetical protein [Candidatus Absconditicoccus praedator]UFX83469.1 hypothetical protein HLG78_05055 [Candidatus Absconditicoccus praedator]
MIENIYFNQWPEIGIYAILNNMLLIILLFLIFFSLISSIFFLFKILIQIKKNINEKKKLKIIRKEMLEFYRKKLLHSDGKEFIKNTVNFFETMQIKGEYKNIEDVIKLITPNNQKINQIKETIYKKEDIDPELENFLKDKLKNISL